ncbi:MAG: hypothetical protein ACP5IT_12240 [Thermoproteota archaeon]
MNINEAIRSIIRLSEEVKEIPFPQLVKATTGFSVLPLDLNSEKDKFLFETITASATNFVKLCERSKRRFRGERINEVGRAVENEFVQELKKTSLRPELLGKAGYPDIKVVDPYGRITYLECKTISKEWDSSFRAFYYTEGSKITSDARHLLIGWGVVEERDKYWRVLGWKLSDLYYLKIKLKAEFNASYADLYEKHLVLSEYFVK